MRHIFSKGLLIIVILSSSFSRYAYAEVPCIDQCSVCGSFIQEIQWWPPSCKSLWELLKQCDGCLKGWACPNCPYNDCNRIAKAQVQIWENMLNNSGCANFYKLSNKTPQKQSF